MLRIQSLLLGHFDCQVFWISKRASVLRLLKLTVSTLGSGFQTTWCRPDSSNVSGGERFSRTQRHTEAPKEKTEADLDGSGSSYSRPKWQPCCTCLAVWTPSSALGDPEVGPLGDRSSIQGFGCTVHGSFSRSHES